MRYAGKTEILRLELPARSKFYKQRDTSDALQAEGSYGVFVL